MFLNKMLMNRENILLFLSYTALCKFAEQNLNCVSKFKFKFRYT